jgi:two-component system, cell cycle response regulator DivK
MDGETKIPEVTTDKTENSYTILVAEDIDSNFTLVEILLRRDYKIVRAYNGLEAVRMFQEVKPNLVLMDIQMPVMNGLDATRMIRKMDALIPIVALTAFAFDADRQEFMDAGGTDYIVKPLDPPQLKSKVREFAKKASF